MILRWNDIDRMFGAMNLLQNRMNRIFSEQGGRYGNYGIYGESTPRTNLYDLGEHFEMKAEVPGLTKDDLNVKIQGNYLEISGTQKSDAPDGYSIHRVERGTTTFSRSFTLPSEVDADKVDATLQDGILTLTLPKSETAKPKQITIN